MSAIRNPRSACSTTLCGFKSERRRGSAVSCGSRDTIPGDRGDYTGGRYFADPLIAHIDNEKATVSSGRNSKRDGKLRRSRGATVPREPLDAGPCDGGDNPGRGKLYAPGDCSSPG